MSWEELVVAQELVLGRNLVTYWTTSWLVSSSPDGPFATGAPALHERGRGNDHGSLACLTSGADFQLCGRRDTSVGCKTSDATDCADWDRTTLCSANTLVDTASTPGMLNRWPTGRQTREQKPGWNQNKTAKEQEKKTFQLISSKKTDAE
jgi:hypothetical protein